MGPITNCRPENKPAFQCSMALVLPRISPPALEHIVVLELELLCIDQQDTARGPPQSEEVVQGRDTAEFCVFRRVRRLNDTVENKDKMCRCEHKEIKFQMLIPVAECIRHILDKPGTVARDMPYMTVTEYWKNSAARGMPQN